LLFDANSRSNPIYRLFEFTKINGKPIEKGAQYHIANSRLYKMRHPTGEARGLNVLCLDDTPGKEKFIGLGLDPTGEANAQIAEILIDEFHKPVIAFNLVSKKTQSECLRMYPPQTLQYMAKLKGMRYFNMEDFSGDGGGKLKDMKITYDIASISTLKNETIPNARKLFTKWAAEWTASNPKVAHEVNMIFPEKLDGKKS
jgi:hypothetical protein